MKTTDFTSRRYFLKKGIFGAITFLGGAALVSCGGSDQPADNQPSTSAEAAPSGAAPADPCDVNALTAEDIKKRQSLGYVDETSIREKKCKTCQLFIPASDSRPCAGCSLFSGPVEPNGYCFYWAPQNA